MDFVILANAWNAAVDNSTSKHHIALELTRQGHWGLHSWEQQAELITELIGRKTQDEGQNGVDA